MTSDICGAPISLNKAETLESWNNMVRAFLAHSAETPTHLGAVLQAEPDFALGFACKGLFSLLMGRAEMWEVAEDARTMAHQARAAGPITQREEWFIVALDRWLAESPTGSVAAMEHILDTWPQDAKADFRSRS